MTDAAYPTLIDAQRQGIYITLTFIQNDGSIGSMTVETPVEHSMDARLRDPIRWITLFPEGQKPSKFWVAADQMLTISGMLVAP